MLSNQTTFNSKKYYSLFKEGHEIYRTHVGVAIFFHKNIPNQKIILNTPLEAIVARNNTRRDVIKVSIYNARSHAISKHLLSTLFQHLPKPVWLTGDFNSYHQTKILNDGRLTRTSGTSKSAIDLILASTFSQPILSWDVTDSPTSSDQCVITVNVQSKKSEPQSTITKFNINKTNWYLFASNQAWKKVTNPNRSQSAEARIELFL